jgi:pyruvate kinase
LVEDISQRELFAAAVKEVLDLGLVVNKDTMVIVGGIPLGKTGSTNNIRVHVVGENIV